LEEKLNNVEVTWDNVADKPYEVLHYEQNSSVTVPKTTVRPDLLKLAVWKIEKNSTFAHDVTRVIFDSSVYANVQQPSSCAIQIGWYKSEDGTDWRKSINIITATNDMFDLKSSFDFEIFLESESNFIAFGTRNSGTCASDGVVKEFSGTLTIHLSPGQSLNQTLPWFVVPTRVICLFTLCRSVR